MGAETGTRGRIVQWAWAKAWALVSAAMTISLACQCAHPAERSVSVRDFQVTTWTEKDGVPSNIWAMAQTEDGWLWLGGPNGLYRFDGVRFEPIKLDADPKLRSTAVSCLYAARSGALVIGTTAGGLSILKNGTLTTYDSDETGRAGQINDIAEDAEGNIWAAGLDGLLRFDGRSGHLVGPDWGVPFGPTYGVMLGNQGALWLGTNRGVFVLEQGQRRFQPTGVEVKNFADLVQSPDGRVWVNDGRSLQLLPGQAATSRGSSLRLRTSYLVFFDREGYLWRSGEDTSADLPGLAVRDVLSLDRGLIAGTQDREGNVWFTSSGRTLYRLRRPVIVKAHETSVGMGVGLVADGSGRIWAGFGPTRAEVEDAGIWMFDPPQKRHVRPAKPLAPTALGRAPDGTIWIANEDIGLGMLRGDRLEPSPPLPDTARRPIVAISPDCAGGRWVSVASPGLLRLEGSAWRTNGGVADLPDEAPRMLTCDSAGRLWVGYASGTVARVSGSRAEVFHGERGPGVGNVTALSATARYVAVGGDRGIAVLHKDRFLKMTPTTAKVFDGATGIVEMPDGDIWLNTPRGLVRIDAADIERWRADNGTSAVPAHRFDTSDGYPGAGLVTPWSGPTAARAGDGKIWFGTTAGLAWIDPAAVRRPAVKVPLVVHALSAGSERFEPADGASLMEGTRSIQIDYAALGYSHPDWYRFRYRLDGVDAEWVDAGTRRQAFYSNLGAGNYRFTVNVTDESGAWTDSAASIGFVIPPTFTQTRSFLALCFAAAIGALALLYRLRVRQLTARERLLADNRLHERERIARELHDTLLQGTQALILKVHVAANKLPEDSAARATLGDAMRTADDVMAEARNRIQQLRGGPSTHENFAESLGEIGARLSRDNGPAFKAIVLGTERRLKDDVAEAAFYIAREALLNAFRHARATSIELELTYGHDTFGLRVRDDGVGLPGGNFDSASTTGHWGLRGMRERAREIDTPLDLWTGPGVGTEIQIQIAAVTAYEKQ